MDSTGANHIMEMLTFQQNILIPTVTLADKIVTATKELVQALQPYKTNKYTDKLAAIQ